MRRKTGIPDRTSTGSAFGNVMGSAYEMRVTRLEIERDMLKEKAQRIEDENRYLKGRLEQAQQDLDGLIGIITKRMHKK